MSEEVKFDKNISLLHEEIFHICRLLLFLKSESAIPEDVSAFFEKLPCHEYSNFTIFSKTLFETTLNKSFNKVFEEPESVNSRKSVSRILEKFENFNSSILSSIRIIRFLVSSLKLKNIHTPLQNDHRSDINPPNHSENVSDRSEVFSKSYQTTRMSGKNPKKKNKVSFCLQSPPANSILKNNTINIIIPEKLNAEVENVAKSTPNTKILPTRPILTRSYAIPDSNYSKSFDIFDETKDILDATPTNVVKFSQKGSTRNSKVVQPDPSHDTFSCSASVASYEDLSLTTPLKKSKAVTVNKTKSLKKELNFQDLSKISSSLSNNQKNLSESILNPKRITRMSKTKVTFTEKVPIQNTEKSFVQKEPKSFSLKKTSSKPVKSVKSESLKNHAKKPQSKSEKTTKNKSRSTRLNNSRFVSYNTRLDEDIAHEQTGLTHLSYIVPESDNSSPVLFLNQYPKRTPTDAVHVVQLPDCDLQISKQTQDVPSKVEASKPNRTKLRHKKERPVAQSLSKKERDIIIHSYRRPKRINLVQNSKRSKSKKVPKNMETNKVNPVPLTSRKKSQGNKIHPKSKNSFVESSQRAKVRRRIINIEETDSPYLGVI